MIVEKVEGNLRNNPNDNFRDEDAIGLIVTSNIKHAKKYAETLGKLTSEDIWVLHSDDDDAADKLRSLVEGKGKKPTYIVAVNMVSEGIDVPQIRVIFYATNYKTRLNFMQTTGRGIRKTDHPEDQRCFLYIPMVRPLTIYADELRKVVYHLIRKGTGTEGGIQEKMFVPVSGANPDEAQFWDVDERIELDPKIRAAAEETGYPYTHVAEIVRAYDGYTTPDSTAEPEEKTGNEAAGYQKIEAVKSQVEGSVKNAAYRIFNENVGAGKQAINTHIKRKYGERDEWGIDDPRPLKAIEELSNLTLDNIPESLISLFNWVKSL